MKAPTFTLRQLADFAWSKGAARYNFMDCNNCAVATFLKETGRCADPTVGGSDYSDLDDLPRDRIAFPEGAVTPVCSTPNNYLALAMRLELVIAEQNPATEVRVTRGLVDSQP